MTETEIREAKFAEKKRYKLYDIEGDLCKKALPSTAETQTQVFGCFWLFSPQITPNFTQMPP